SAPICAPRSDTSGAAPPGPSGGYAIHRQTSQLTRRKPKILRLTFPSNLPSASPAQKLACTRYHSNRTAILTEMVESAKYAPQSAGPSCCADLISPESRFSTAARASSPDTTMASIRPQLSPLAQPAWQDAPRLLIGCYFPRSVQLEGVGSFVRGV